MSASAARDLSYLLSGQYSATYPGQLRAFDAKSGQPVGDAVEVGPGPTSIVVSTRKK